MCVTVDLECVCACVCVQKKKKPEPCDVIDEVLTYVAKRLHALEKGGQRYTEFIFFQFLSPPHLYQGAHWTI